MLTPILRVESKTLTLSWRWRNLEVTQSTQDLAIAAAHDGEPGRLAILARHQTAGRGSRGRNWEGQGGNLFLSLLIRPENPLSPGLYALRAGVALHEALSPYAQNLMLKWPNDLLLGGAKLAGILIDADAGDGWFVIGIGANLASAPHIHGRATACLPPPAPPPEKIANSITSAIDQHTTASDIAAAWLSRAHPLGTALDITTPAGRRTGRFAGITERGALLLEGEPRAISSGEVFLGVKNGENGAMPDRDTLC